MKETKITIFIAFFLLLIASFLIYFANFKPLKIENLNNFNFTNEDLNFSFSNIQIPPHINLLDFYSTYGERLLGDENIKIISREEWGANNNYANPLFINELCKTMNCSLKEYDPEDSFSQEEYFKAKSLMINYLTNFEKYNDLFLQTKRKENGVNYRYLPVEEIVIHHTAGKFTLELEDSIKEVQRIYLLHSILRRWRDIGYHYLIDGKGRIFEGTLGGKYSVGAHTYYHNDGTIGIALMGDFRKGHDKITKEMLDSLIKLILYLKKEYKWNLEKRVFLLKTPDLSKREWSDKFIKGHNELDIRKNPTSCPGVSPQQLRELIYPYLFSSS